MTENNILEFPSFDNNNGILTMFQSVLVNSDNKLPFEIKRVLVMKGMGKGDSRGGHTHHKTRQVLFAISGSCVVDLDDGKNKSSVMLDKFNKGVLLEPYVWHTMKDFSDDAVLLVLANSEYDEKDYIRSYEDFLKFIV